MGSEPSNLPGTGQLPTTDGKQLLQGNEEISISQAQKIVDTWIRSVGVRYFSELTNLAQLMEEVGELARIISRTYGEQSFKASDRNKSLSDEMADVLFVLICLANQTGVDLTSALKSNIEKKTQRDSQRHQQNEKLTGPQSPPPN